MVCPWVPSSDTGLLCRCYAGRVRTHRGRLADRTIPRSFARAKATVREGADGDCLHVVVEGIGSISVSSAVAARSLLVASGVPSADVELVSGRGGDGSAR